MKNIILTGFMGTGKTVVGKILSKLLRIELIDVDTEIERSEKMTISEIFRRFGESRFREIETEMIKKLSLKNNVIISTGGGAVLKKENMDILKKSGIIVCLLATPETILKRTSYTTNRPLLQVEDPLRRIKELLDYRKPFYEKADVMIDTEGKNPSQIAQEIIEKIKEDNGKSQG
ncbi:MAG: shikimate kinase [Nitrospirae bacterium]|nr:shikimate kinase [Nitrospirota bacterium]